MIKAYNFLGSWQLFPEKGTYEEGHRPKSGIYTIEAPEGTKQLTISHHWVDIENSGFTSRYTLTCDGDRHPAPDQSLGTEVLVNFVDSIHFSISFYSGADATLSIDHEIMPNGYLKITIERNSDEGRSIVNTEYYHRQMSVLPYAASVSGAVIKPTKEGVIRHKALTAMEEQTNMQLEQIRKQIELLALQAQEIHQRKELSHKIYSARLNFKPEIGQIYHLYQKEDDTHLISLISPKEWGNAMPYKSFVASVQLLADHTWKEL